jgi:hypothetical protein
MMRAYVLILAFLSVQATAFAQEQGAPSSFRIPVVSPAVSVDWLSQQRPTFLSARGNIITYSGSQNGLRPTPIWPEGNPSLGFSLLCQQYGEKVCAQIRLLGTRSSSPIDHQAPLSTAK